MISKKPLIFLTMWIIENTEFEKILEDPKFFKLSKKEMSDKACFSDDKCRVKAYYIKEGKIFYLNSMEPEKQYCDQSIILHELVHHYQKNSGK